LERRAHSGEKKIAERGKERDSRDREVEDQGGWGESGMVG